VTTCTVYFYQLLIDTGAEVIYLEHDECCPWFSKLPEKATYRGEFMDRRHHSSSYTVIRFVSTRAKFGICIVVILNGTLVEDKMRSS